MADINALQSQLNNLQSGLNMLYSLKAKYQQGYEQFKASNPSQAKIYSDNIVKIDSQIYTFSNQMSSIKQQITQLQQQPQYVQQPVQTQYMQQQRTFTMPGYKTTTVVPRVAIPQGGEETEEESNMLMYAGIGLAAMLGLYMYAKKE